jgi:hypothetical protein
VRTLVTAAVLLLGCDPDAVVVPAPDYADFREQIYPLLLRDCGMTRCHGDVDRFFVIWGPGRTRLDADGETPLEPFDPPSDNEIWMSYQRTRSSLSHAGAVDQAPLLRKPLDGHDHGGEDGWGFNLWRHDDPRWQLLARWAVGEPLDTPVEVGP